MKLILFVLPLTSLACAQDMNMPGMNSWSTRLWYFPTKNWAAQVSIGRIARPEALEPGDQVRSTASVSYTRAGWSSSLIWGRNHNTATQRNTNSYLAESVVPCRAAISSPAASNWPIKMNFFCLAQPSASPHIRSATRAISRYFLTSKQASAQTSAFIPFPTPSRQFTAIIPSAAIFSFDSD